MQSLGASLGAGEQDRLWICTAPSTCRVKEFAHLEEAFAGFAKSWPDAQQATWVSSMRCTSGDGGDAPTSSVVGEVAFGEVAFGEDGEDGEGVVCDE